MDINIKHIIEGWANVIKDTFNLLDDNRKEMAQNRILMCNDCDMRVGGTCSPGKKGKHIITGEEVTGCGCFIAAKSMSPESKCPLGKWETIKTGEK